MAGNRVVIKFIGEDSSLKRSLKELEVRAGTIGDRFGRAGDAMGKVVKPLAMLGAAGGAVKVLGGAAAAGQQLLPIALLLPGALLMGAAAMGTFKLATAGFSDALSGDADAMAKLSPNARATAQAIKGFSGEFDNLKKSVQDQFFKGFADDVKNLGNQYLPVLQERLPKIASQFNAMGKSIAYALSRPAAQNDVEKVLDNTTSLLGNMKNALGHVTSGFLGLAGVGSTYLPRLGTAIDGVAAKFKNWVDKSVASGQINELIDGAIAGFKDLAAIAGNVGSILSSVWKGLSGGSGATSPLSTLKDLTAGLADFFKSAEAQGPLKALGETMAALSTVVKDVLLAALKALAPIVESLAPIVTTLGKAIGDILISAFEQLGPPVKNLIDKLNPLLQQTLPWIADIIKNTVIPALADFINWISDNLDNIKLFAAQTVVAFLEASSSVLDFVSFTLGAMSKVFAVLGLLPGEFGASMRSAAVSTNTAKEGVDHLRGTVDQLKSKSIEVLAQTQAAQRVIDGFIRMNDGRTVTIYTSVLGSGGIMSAGRLATGGPVSGPGTGTSDTAGLFALSNGEYVLTAQQVKNAGGTAAIGHLAGALNQGSVSGMARGGPISTKPYAAPTSSGGGTTAVTFAGNTSDALATVIQKMIRTGQIQIRTT